MTTMQIDLCNLKITFCLPVRRRQYPILVRNDEVPRCDDQEDDGVGVLEVGVVGPHGPDAHHDARGHGQGRQREHQEAVDHEENVQSHLGRKWK